MKKYFFTFILTCIIAITPAFSKNTNPDIIKIDEQQYVFDKNSHVTIETIDDIYLPEIEKNHYAGYFGIAMSRVSVTVDTKYDMQMCRGFGNLDSYDKSHIIFTFDSIYCKNNGKDYLLNPQHKQIVLNSKEVEVSFINDLIGNIKEHVLFIRKPELEINEKEHIKTIKINKNQKISFNLGYISLYKVEFASKGLNNE